MPLADTQGVIIMLTFSASRAAANAVGSPYAKPSCTCKTHMTVMWRLHDAGRASKTLCLGADRVGCRSCTYRQSLLTSHRPNISSPQGASHVKSRDMYYECSRLPLSPIYSVIIDAQRQTSLLRLLHDSHPHFHKSCKHI